MSTIGPGGQRPAAGRFQRPDGSTALCERGATTIGVAHQQVRRVLDVEPEFGTE